MNTQRIGRIAFESSSSELNQAFDWAKRQALSYAHIDGLAGPWYEAALPGRNAFCMRDVAHQSTGAHLLGLQEHNKNMLRQFARHISQGKDWCTYWEITKDGLPASVDYDSDEDFWYNLPANFDLIDSCLRQYQWTGETDYTQHPEMIQFYDRSVNDYVERWDKDGDGVPEHYASYGRRGIASYVEDGLHPLVGGDLVAALYGGYRAYSTIQLLRGHKELSAEFAAKASHISRLYNDTWWNEQAGRFNGAIMQDRSSYSDYYATAHFLPLYFGLVEDLHKDAVLRDVVRHGGNNVEERSYLAEIYYNHGLEETAYSALLELSSPHTSRRSYPEVSYSIISSLFTGMMGIVPDAANRVLATLPRLDPIQWCSGMNIPVWKNEINLSHLNNQQSVLENVSGDEFVWEARFPGKRSTLFVDGVECEATTAQDRHYGSLSSISLHVKPGQKIVVGIVNSPMESV